MIPRKRNAAHTFVVNGEAHHAVAFAQRQCRTSCSFRRRLGIHRQGDWYEDPFGPPHTQGLKGSYRQHGDYAFAKSSRRRVPVPRSAPQVIWVALEAICEQVPNPASRVSLSERKDKFAVALAKIDWRISDLEYKTLLRIAELSHEALARAELPTPKLESWATERRTQDLVIIDMAHTLGMTRMSTSPKTGIADVNCRVHGINNFYIGGGSVFPDQRSRQSDVDDPVSCNSIGRSFE
ncbi:GMC oxidoreductase [Ensifer sp. 4252]|uniref:GMC oxidoreductase n=1 Tax=Ensifer sp. 4252 TaxID=3373915 RepID=UPI003D22B463